MDPLTLTDWSKLAGACCVLWPLGAVLWLGILNAQGIWPDEW